ncbi:MAG: GNAT family N-acetyltransferase [Chloroflexota bacterium]|nr:GNAT family N-acetyltransferase [Anaerolineae bacterium]HMM28989.1 GNAT family N-acetyltransferase [Aggregatilineaceae bacterium]
MTSTNHPLPGELSIASDRLALVACSIAMAHGIIHDRPRAEALLGATIPAEWPLPALRGFVPFYIQMLAGDPAMLGWGMWLVVHAADRVVIGDVGFKGRSDGSDTVDIGYSILPAYRNQGYAYEAARALIDWAFEQPGIARVIATCLPSNAPSIRVLEKLGMQRTGTTASGMLAWTLAKGS